MQYFWRVCLTIVEVQKKVCITYSEFVFVALIIQRANRMIHVILSSLPYPALHNFSTLSKKGARFWENLSYIKGVF
jgi:hypothetical protein